jgi:hypothetical protein
MCKFGTAEQWGAAGTWLGAAAAVIAIGYAAAQIKDAREALQATTIYNIEKDYNGLFKRIDKTFLDCFGKKTSAAAQQPPSMCSDIAARQTLFEVLDFYRLLIDLANNGAIENKYVDARIRGFCPYFTSSGGKFMLDVFRDQGAIRKDLDQRITAVCEK